MPIPSIPPYDIPQAPSGAAVGWTPDPDRSALLVHDMQNYFIDAYEPNQDPIRSAIANIRALVDAADDAGVPVFYSVQPPRQQSARRGLLSEFWGSGMQTERDAEVIAPLSPRAHHHVVTKWRYSAFQRTDLGQSLAFAKRDQLLICGVYGHMGCQVTAADAFMDDIQAFLVRDAIADFSADDHARAIGWVARRAGRVLDTDDVVECLGAARLKQEVHA